MLLATAVLPIRRYCDVLKAAAQTVGGDRKLAAFLDVSPHELQRWLEGEIAPPLPAFLQALDLAARGPYGPRKRRIRVAVIPPKDL